MYSLVVSTSSLSSNTGLIAYNSFGRFSTTRKSPITIIASKAMRGLTHRLSRNKLWAFVTNFLTITPGKEVHGRGHEVALGVGQDG